MFKKMTSSKFFDISDIVLLSSKTYTVEQEEFTDTINGYKTVFEQQKNTGAIHSLIVSSNSASYPCVYLVIDDMTLYETMNSLGVMGCNANYLYNEYGLTNKTNYLPFVSLWDTATPKYAVCLVSDPIPYFKGFKVIAYSTSTVSQEFRILYTREREEGEQI